MSPRALLIASERRPLSTGLRAFVVAICVAIVLGALWFQYDARRALLAKSEADAGMLANSLAQHATDTFEVADVLLATLAERLQTSPGRSLDDIYLLDSALENQLRSVPRIRSLIAYDRAGRQFASSQPLIPDWFDLSQDEAFEFHKADFDDAIRIGSPVRSPSTGDWIVTVSRRWNDASGQFAGIVVATVRVDYFTNFYRDFDVSGGAAISLLRGDGLLLSRYPSIEAQLGRPIRPDAAAFEETLRHTTGVQTVASPIDGIVRIYGYRRTMQIPLLLYVGISTDIVLAGWLERSIAIVGAACVLALSLGLVGWRFAADVDARQTAEREWSTLALTDGLTGVRNRRAFDEALQREWRLAQERHRSLSLLMLDVDHFKAFNDASGHVAGDACLKEIAEAIGRSVHRSGDIVARYGGEEFALLLADTGQASALLIAERVRQSILHLGIGHPAGGTLPIVSVSVGVATQAFDPAEPVGTPAGLIERADRALYRAKVAGRNRVEMDAPASAPRFALAEAV